MTKIKLAHIALMILLIVAMILSLQGCATAELQSIHGKEPDEPPPSMFVMVERAYTWIIVYHRDTKVMYAVSNGSYNYGAFTMLVDAEGNPLTYTG